MSYTDRVVPVVVSFFHEPNNGFLKPHKSNVHTHFAWIPACAGMTTYVLSVINEAK